VAAENKVRIACHPQDPHAAARFIAHPQCAGHHRRAEEVRRHARKPYHGLNFCQGTVSENLYHPNDEIGDVIRYFGSRKKIFNVHSAISAAIAMISSPRCSRRRRCGFRQGPEGLREVGMKTC